MQTEDFDFMSVQLVHSYIYMISTVQLITGGLVKRIVTLFSLLDILGTQTL